MKYCFTFYIANLQQAIYILLISGFFSVISESTASDIEKIKLMVDLNAEKLKKLEKPKKKKVKVKKETGIEEVEKKKRKPRKKKEKECLVMMDEDGEEDEDDNCAAIKCLKPTGQLTRD